MRATDETHPSNEGQERPLLETHRHTHNTMIISQGETDLCLGTVKRARTSFLLLDLVFMFMQKSMAACHTHTVNIRRLECVNMVLLEDLTPSVWKSRLALSMRSLLTQLGSCWMKASTISFRWEPVLASSSSCSANTDMTNS